MENLNSIEAAKHLCVSVQTLANWRCKRKGPVYIKMPGAGKIVYGKNDLDAFLERGRIDPEADRS